MFGILPSAAFAHPAQHILPGRSNLGRYAIQTQHLIDEFPDGPVELIVV